MRVIIEESIHLPNLRDNEFKTLRNNFCVFHENGSIVPQKIDLFSEDMEIVLDFIWGGHDHNVHINLLRYETERYKLEIKRVT